MKLGGLFLLAVLIISAVVSCIYVYYSVWDAPSQGDFFFGVSFGQQTAEEAKILIDKVKGYTNFFLINSWEIATNETALDEVCNYAAQAGMRLRFPMELFLCRARYETRRSDLIHVCGEPFSRFQARLRIWFGGLRNRMTKIMRQEAKYQLGLR